MNWNNGHLLDILDIYRTFISHIRYVCLARDCGKSTKAPNREMMK
jgi:hypothetical protein